MMFTDDPSELVHSMEDAWDRYAREGFDLVLRDCAARVETWRYARDAEYIPNQPFWKFLDTVGRGHEWQLRQMRWIPKADGSPSLCEHGFDRDGRLVFVRWTLGGWRKATCIVYGDGFYDILVARLKEDSDTFRNWGGGERSR